MASMGTFFEDLGKRIGETAENVSNKAGEAMEIQRLKNQVRMMERGIDSDLAELGRTVYEKFKEGEAVGEDAALVCESIQEQEHSIAECRQKISQLRGNSQCLCCGKTILKDMAYCPYCGVKKPEEEKAAEEEPFEETGYPVEDSGENTEENKTE